MMLGTRVAPISTDKIREIAYQVRIILNVQKACVNISKILEFELQKHGISYDILSRSDMGNKEGIADTSENVIMLREDVYEELCSGNKRARFTVAHEIGHFALEHKASFNRTSNSSTHKIYEDSEWQADTFAAEFLMPHTFLQRQCGSIDDISSIFDVTPSAAKTRYRKLKKEGLLLDW